MKSIEHFTFTQRIRSAMKMKQPLSTPTKTGSLSLKSFVICAPISDTRR